ncbi:MAG: hypothetical protein ACREDF_08785 [Thermoplasmata archaeon]
MAMVYTDEPEAMYLMGMGQAELIRQALSATGIRDPIRHYEGDTPLPQVFAKYSTSLDRYPGEVALIRSGSVQRSLRNELDGLVRQRNEIAPAFAPGAVPGARDRDRLAILVQGVRSFRKKLTDARKRYGAGAPAADTFMVPMPRPAPRPPAEGFPIWIPLAAGVALLALA